MQALWKKWIGAALTLLFGLSVASASQALATVNWSVEDSFGAVGSGVSASTATLADTLLFTLFLSAPDSGTDDAFSLNFNAINTSPRAQTYSLSLILTTPPTSLAGGSIAASSSFTLADGSTPRDGAFLSSVGGEAIFRATLSGLPAATLFDSPYQLSCASGARLACNTVDSASTGPSPISALGTPTSRGIVYQFELGPGDSLAASSSVGILTVPEPSLGVLMLLGGSWLISRRRRTSPRPPYSL